MAMASAMSNEPTKKAPDKSYEDAVGDFYYHRKSSSSSASAPSSS